MLFMVYADVSEYGAESSKMVSRTSIIVIILIGLARQVGCECSRNGGTVVQNCTQRCQ